MKNPSIVEHIALWFFAFLVLFFFLSYTIALYLWGVMYEESQVFFSALLIQAGETPFFFRQLAFFIANIGGVIADLSDAGVNDEVPFLNDARGLSLTALFFSVLYFPNTASITYDHLTPCAGAHLPVMARDCGLERSFSFYRNESL